MRWQVLFLIPALAGIAVKAQEKDTVSSPGWSHTPSVTFYVFKDDFFVVPVYQVNHDWLHLEARYNYEDRNTFSGWFGYNFSGGNTFQYMITPIIGGLAGNTYGIAPGMRISLEYYGFQFYSESEFVFDVNSTEGDFYYNWTDLSYSPAEWLWFGMNLQRTRLFQSKPDIQFGFLLGGGYRWFGLTGYVINLGIDDPYLVVSLTATLPEE